MLFRSNLVPIISNFLGVEVFSLLLLPHATSHIMYALLFTTLSISLKISRNYADLTFKVPTTMTNPFGWSKV